MFSFFSTWTPLASSAPAKISASRAFSEKFAEPTTTGPDAPLDPPELESPLLRASLPLPHAASSSAARERVRPPVSRLALRFMVPRFRETSLRTGPGAVVGPASPLLRPYGVHAPDAP